MTAPFLTPVLAAPRAAVVAVAAGCGALTLRPVLLETAGLEPAALLGALFVVLLAGSLLWRAPAGAAAEAKRSAPVLPVLGLGVAAFVAGRLLLTGAPPPAPATALVVGLNTLAAFAEEAFFRRLVYGALLRGGPALAIGGSALLFAAVHVTVYGPWVLPLDFAAGLLFGWQRRATGSWMVPAVTHAVANLLVVL